MENWMVLVVSAAVILLGFAFLASLIYMDHVSERRRVVMCSMYVLLIAALVVFFAIKRGETSKDSSSPVKTATADLPVVANEENEVSSFPVKTATADSSIVANEENKASSPVVEPNDAAEAGVFVIENLRYELDLELRGNPWVLARYLQEHDTLDEFAPSEGRSAEAVVNAAASLFLTDDSIRERAYEKAVKLFSDAILDAVWEEFKKANPQSAKFDTYEEYWAYLRNPAARPLARIAETGETISTEPAGPWEGPSD